MKLRMKNVLPRIGSQAIFSISQPNILANKKRKFMLSTSISKESNNNVNFQWAPFPVEMTGVYITAPLPSGSKLLVIRNPENESPTQFEIWSSSPLEKEFRIPQSADGSVYADGWESLGTLMNLLLLMLLMSHLPASLRLIVRVTSKVLQKIKNA